MNICMNVLCIINMYNVLLYKHKYQRHLFDYLFVATLNEK